jgi:hypothetical protein
MSRLIKRAKSTDCTNGSWQAVKSKNLSPNIDRADITLGSGVLMGVPCSVRTALPTCMTGSIKRCSPILDRALWHHFRTYQLSKEPHEAERSKALRRCVMRLPGSDSNRLWRSVPTLVRTAVASATRCCDRNKEAITTKALGVHRSGQLATASFVTILLDARHTKPTRGPIISPNQMEV